MSWLEAIGMVALFVVALLFSCGIVLAAIYGVTAIFGASPLVVMVIFMFLMLALMVVLTKKGLMFR